MSQHVVNAVEHVFQQILLIFFTMSQLQQFKVILHELIIVVPDGGWV
jgi:hypothetical protein